MDVSFTGNVTLDISPEVGTVELDGQVIDDALWQLAGAMDGATVAVTKAETPTRWGTVDAIMLTVSHPVLLMTPMVRNILAVNEVGYELAIMENVEFYLREQFRGQGIGTASLAVEAIAANALGFAKIVAIAADAPDDGWKVWPRLGYDAFIDVDLLAKMQADLDANNFVWPGLAPKISDLYKQDLAWVWEKHGAGCIMEFDVSSDDTWSMKRLMAAVERKE